MRTNSVSPKSGKGKKESLFITRLTGPRPWYWPFHWKPRFTWRGLFIVLGVGFAVLALGITGVFAYFVRDLPNPRQLSNRSVAESTKILDRNGKLIYSFFGSENRTLLKPEQINAYSKNASIALEDSEFYSHPGFSVKGLGRAAWCKVRGSYCGGGSTITQQFVKNALLTSEQTADRKLRDLILAIEVEQVYTKEEILTGYLNEISYGGNVYGLEAAAQNFFGKSAIDLTLSEAATLASIPQQPTYFSPYGDHLEDLFARKDYALDRMALLGLVSKEEAEAAKLAAPNLEKPTFTRKTNITAPHFVFYIRQQLLKFMGEDPQLAEIKLDQAGYVVTTSIDMEAQTLAENILKEMGPSTVKKYGASNAALTAVDPKTGEVIAMAGSIDYDNSRSGNTNFANALLQPGSSFKPIVFATAFDKENKKSPASITFDLDTDFGNYRPKNYNGQFRGPVTNRNALAQSLNIPAVKNLHLVGISNAIATAERMGITSLSGKPGDYGLSLVLGSGEVRPVELASAYGTFANEGMHHNLRPILTIEKNGEMVKDFRKEEAKKAIEPEVAYQISNILSDNAARAPIFGTKNSLTLPDRPVAAKTGTTNNNRDAWTAGYTPQIATVVWVGNNEPNKTMVAGADGSYVAAPIWNRFMREYLKGKPVEEFKRPSTITELTVDFLSGKLPTDQSPENQRVKDIFAPWQIPTENDNVHIKLRIDKTSGKLATDLTPPELVEERIYFTITSEQPNNPNWENPVQAWAQANGGGVKPPTDFDDVHTETNRPTLSFVSPKSGDSFGDSVSLEVSVGGNRPITKVEFYVDNVLAGTRTSAPWRVDYNASALASGTHIITAKVMNDLNMTRTEEVSANKTTSGNSGPLSPVINPSIMRVGKNAVITWSNPPDAALAGVRVYQSLNAGVLGTLIRTVPATPNNTGTTTVENLAPGTYYFSLRPVDSNGARESTSGQQLSITIL